jgi:hypothetical protein
MLVLVMQDFKPVGQMLEQKGLVKFSPHYLIWVCQFGSDADECKTQCIKQGAYCCPDPDDDIHEGYSGRDVLLVGGFCGFAAGWKGLLQPPFASSHQGTVQRYVILVLRP